MSVWSQFPQLCTNTDMAGYTDPEPFGVLATQPTSSSQKGHPPQDTAIVNTAFPSCVPRTCTYKHEKGDKPQVQSAAPPFSEVVADWQLAVS